MCVWGCVFQAQEEMAWRIAKMIVNDVMQQAQCEQPLEKVTKVGGGKAAAFSWLQPACGRSRALTCLPPVAETHAGKCSNQQSMRGRNEGWKCFGLRVM